MTNNKIEMVIVISRCFAMSLGKYQTDEFCWIGNRPLKEINSLFYALRVRALRVRKFKDFDFMSYKMNGDLVPLEGWAEDALWKPFNPFW